MAVIVRTERILEDGSTATERVYRGFGPPTAKVIQHAERLDKHLSEELPRIAARLKARGLLKGRRGNRERWYELGKYLQEIVEDPKYVLPEDRRQDQHIWIAIAQNAPKELHPGMEVLGAKNIPTKRNHFRLCYQLGRLPKDIVQQHTWREWVEILESPAIIDDERIVAWIIKKMGSNKRIELRPLARGIRQQLKGIYTAALSDEELTELLDEVLHEVTSFD